MIRQFIPRFNPNTDHSQGHRTQSSDEKIPEGHSITGIGYRNNPDGSHADTYFRVAPETPSTLARRAFRDKR